MAGSLNFQGPPGEFISNGSRISLTAPGMMVSVIERDPQSLELTFQGNDGWELDLAAPDGKPLALGRYKGAQRYPFQEPRHPGLSLSGAGRACNTISGEFTVTRLVRDERQQIKEFTAEFAQRCGDNRQTLKGLVQIQGP